MVKNNNRNKQQLHIDKSAWLFVVAHFGMCSLELTNFYVCD